MSKITISKRGRFWAVELNGSLLAVVVYKRGAREIARHFTELERLALDSLAPIAPRVA